MIQSDQMVIVKWRERVIGTLIMMIVCLVVTTLLLINHSLSKQNILNLQSLLSLITLLHSIFIGALVHSLYKKAVVAFGIGVFTLVLSFFAMGVGTFLFTFFILYKSKTILKKMQGQKQ